MTALALATVNCPASSTLQESISQILQDEQGGNLAAERRRDPLTGPLGGLEAHDISDVCFFCLPGHRALIRANSASNSASRA